MQKIRTFVAVEIPSPLRQALSEMIDELRRIPVDIKWVRPESIHITLKFLGEITPEEVQKVFTAVEHVAARHSPFALSTAAGGAFPSLSRPKVYWIGLNPANQDRLNHLQQDLEEQLEKFGFPREKRAFRPHLTIGRVRHPRGIEVLNKQFMAYPFPEYSLPVNALLVMKSELRREGARYTIQKSFVLQKM